MMGRKRIFLTIIFALVLSAILGAVVGYSSLPGLLGITVIFFGGVSLLWPRGLLYLSILSIVLGQLLRIPLLGEESAILPNDIILPALMVAWLVRGLATKTIQLPRSSLWLPLLGTMLMMLISILLNHSSYDQREWWAGALYFIRWIEYAFLFLIIYDLTRTTDEQQRVTRWLIGSAISTAVLGFVQLKLFPDFTFMVPNGWDPHIGRLLSTWFDPNFLGGFLAMVAAIALAQALLRPSKNFGWWTLFVILAVAEVLTFSRSGYLGFVAAVVVVTMVRSRALLFLGAVATISVVLLVPRVQERVIGIRSVDQTAQFRIVSWNNALDIVSDHRWFGVGYNHYKYAQEQRGFITDTSEHSASGSDSSLLTILVTTGIAGTIFYVWLYGAIMWEFLRTAKMKSLSPTTRALGLGSLAAMIGLFVHSQFVNGWFYPHIMETIWILVAITHRQRNV